MILSNFIGCNNFDEVKKKYKELSKKYHPDLHVGIDIALMQTLNVQYEYIEKNVITYPIGQYKPPFNPFNAADEFARKAREANKRPNPFTAPDNDWAEFFKQHFTTGNATAGTPPPDPRERERSRPRSNDRDSPFEDFKYWHTDNPFKEERGKDNVINDIIIEINIRTRGLRPLMIIYYRFLDQIFSKGLQDHVTINNFYLLAQLMSKDPNWATYKFEEFKAEVFENSKVNNAGRSYSNPY